MNTFALTVTLLRLKVGCSLVVRVLLLMLWLGLVMLVPLVIGCRKLLVLSSLVPTLTLKLVRPIIMTLMGNMTFTNMANIRITWVLSLARLGKIPKRRNKGKRYYERNRHASYGLDEWPLFGQRLGLLGWYGSYGSGTL